MGGFPEDYGYPVDHQPKEIGIDRDEEEWVTKEMQAQTNEEIRGVRMYQSGESPYESHEWISKKE